MQKHNEGGIPMISAKKKLVKHGMSLVTFMTFVNNYFQNLTYGSASIDLSFAT